MENSHNSDTVVRLSFSVYWQRFSASEMIHNLMGRLMLKTLFWAQGGDLPGFIHVFTPISLSLCEVERA